MFCNPCAIANELYACSGSLIVGMVEQPNTDYFIFLENNSSDSTYRYEVTSDGAGLITWTLPSVSPFAVGTPYTLWMTLATAEDRVTVTQGINTWTCITLTFRNLFDDEGCCVCPDSQTIIVKVDSVIPEPGCLCVTQEMLNAAGRPYKVYTAMLTDAPDPGDPPIAIIFENTIGAIILTHPAIGQYELKSAGLFIENKTWFTITPVDTFEYDMSWIDVNTISITVSQRQISIPGMGEPIQYLVYDGRLFLSPIEIRVYN